MQLVAARAAAEGKSGIEAFLQHTISPRRKASC
jgi:hypothetical protein